MLDSDSTADELKSSPGYDSGDLEKAVELYESHLWIVGTIMNRNYSHLTGDDFQDVCQVARIGLWSAAVRYDASHGAAFSTYAYKTTRGTVWRWVRDVQSLIRVPEKHAIDGVKVETIRESDIPEEWEPGQAADETDVEADVISRLIYQRFAFDVDRVLKVFIKDSLKRALLIQHLRDEVTAIEAAKRLGVSRQTFYAYKKRALSGLKERLDKTKWRELGII